MYSPSSSASAAIFSRSRVNENESSVMEVMKMLAHLVPVDHLAHPNPDRGGAAQRLLGALGGSHDRQQILLGGGQQLLPLAPPLIGQHRVAAHDQAFAGELG